MIFINFNKYFFLYKFINQFYLNYYETVSKDKKIEFFYYLTNELFLFG